MSQENIEDLDVNVPENEEPRRAVPLQPELVLGLENNENRRNSNQVPQGSVSFSHFLGRGSGAPHLPNVLPDFVQDHLPDIPFDLTQSCDNQSLPDFLSDTYRNSNSEPQSSSLSNSSNAAQNIENQNLIERLCRQLAQQSALIVNLENQFRERNSNNGNENSEQQDLQALVSSLQQEVESLRAENRLLKRNINTSSSLPSTSSASNARTFRIAQELRSLAQNSESLLSQLTSNVSSWKNIASHLERDHVYRDAPSDSEDDG